VSSVCKVLIVEDDLYVRQLLGDVFHDEGYAFVLADSGEAMAHVLGHDPAFDVIVIDVGLPGEKNGLTLAEEAASLGYAVVLVTGDPNRFDGVAKSGHRHLLKPFRIAQLIETIQEILIETGNECRRAHAVNASP
jgi:DNA-binding response OmpR family regulator